MKWLVTTLNLMTGRREADLIVTAKTERGALRQAQKVCWRDMDKYSRRAIRIG